MPTYEEINGSIAALQHPQQPAFSSEQFLGPMVGRASQRNDADLAQNAWSSRDELEEIVIKSHHPQTCERQGDTAPPSTCDSDAFATLELLSEDAVELRDYCSLFGSPMSLK